MLPQALRPYVNCGFCGEHRMHFGYSFNMEGDCEPACRGCCVREGRLRVEEGKQRDLVHALRLCGRSAEQAMDIAGGGIGSSRWRHALDGAPAESRPLWLHARGESPMMRGQWDGASYRDREGKVVDARWWMCPTTDDLRDNARCWQNANRPRPALAFKRDSGRREMES